MVRERAEVILYETLACARSAIHRRIGPEIHEKAVARALDALLSEGAIVATGERRWRKFRPAADKGQRP